MNELLFERIKLLIRTLYWDGDIVHNIKTGDIYYQLDIAVRNLEGILKSCIQILSVSNINSKELVRKELEKIIYGIKKEK